MTRFSYRLRPPEGPILGLVALQVDQTIERDFRRLFPLDTQLYVSRVPSGAEVTPDTLARMARHLADAAGLLPPQCSYDVVAYGCTSGTAQIGPQEVARHLRTAQRSRCVSEPVSALVAACAALSARRLAILSPYVADVSTRLCEVLGTHGIDVAVLGSFEEAEEARVARIDAGSIRAAAEMLVKDREVDALFLSCTNLRTLDVIAPLEMTLGMPVLSSNLVLAWHMARAAGLALQPDIDAHLLRP